MHLLWDINQIFQQLGDMYCTAQYLIAGHLVSAFVTRKKGRKKRSELAPGTLKNFTSALLPLFAVLCCIVSRHMRDWGKLRFSLTIWNFIA